MKTNQQSWQNIKNLWKHRAFNPVCHFLLAAAHELNENHTSSQSRGFFQAVFPPFSCPVLPVTAPRFLFLDDSVGLSLLFRSPSASSLCILRCCHATQTVYAVLAFRSTSTSLLVSLDLVFTSLLTYPYILKSSSWLYKGISHVSMLEFSMWTKLFLSNPSAALQYNFFKSSFLSY